MIKITKATLHDLKRIAKGYAVLTFQCEKAILEVKAIRRILRLHQNELDQLYKDISKELKYRGPK